MERDENQADISPGDDGLVGNELAALANDDPWQHYDLTGERTEQAAEFAEKVIEGTGLDPEFAAEMTPFLGAWFDRWSVEPTGEDEPNEPA